MNDKESSIMGKYVNDMYGSRVGKAIGTTTDIDGTVITVGIDCGYRGLMEIPFEHLVVQEDSIVYVPQWRLDSQKILREKGLIIRRLRALHIILSENDNMKTDSETVRHEYEEKLASINESEYTIKEMLATRISELTEQIKVAKALRFDATIQYKSKEMEESEYNTAKASITDMLERIEYEIGEIKNMQGRLEELTNEESQIYDSVQVENMQEAAQESAEAIPRAPVEDLEPAIMEHAPEPEQVAIPAAFAGAAPEPEVPTAEDIPRYTTQPAQHETMTIPPEVPNVPDVSGPQIPEYNIPKPPPEPPKSDWLTRMTSQ